MIKIKKIDVQNNNIQVFEFYNDSIISAGRDNNNKIHLNDSTVSSCHIELRCKSKHWYVYDNDSKNGTFLNGKLLKRLAEILVNVNDIITIGQNHIQILEIKEDIEIKTDNNNKKDQVYIDHFENEDFFRGFFDDEKRYFHDPDILAIKTSIHNKLHDEIDLRRIKVQELNINENNKIITECESIVRRIVLKEMRNEISKLNIDTEIIIKDILDEALKLGPLEDLMSNKDSNINEIMVLPNNRIYVEIKGKSYLTYRKFRNKESLKGIISRIVGPTGRRVDEASPMVDCRLPCGSRVNIALLADGPSITIRKFPQNALTIDDLIKYKTLSTEMAKLLQLAVENKQNVIISGGTGSGKTSTLNVLSSFIEYKDRVITIEDTLELRLNIPHLVRMEARPPNIEGVGEISIRHLFKNSLRMAPSRIVIGECRSAETSDILQAMNSGHVGSLTTAHSNNPKDLILRLENMASLDGLGLPSRTIRQQISTAINLIIQQDRINEKRVITSIAEVIGFEDDDIITREIFYYKRNGSKFIATGFIPNFILDMIENDIDVDMDIFKSN